MAKRKAAPASLYKTDKFVFDLGFYMEAIRNPTWERRPLKFPYVQERDAANIAYDSPMERRTYYGVVPKPGPRENNGDIYSRYQIRDNFDYASGPNRFINTANYYRLPDNMIATTSGLYEVPEGELHPDYTAPSIGNYEYISQDITYQNIGAQEVIIANYPFRQSRFDGRPDNEYYPAHTPSQRIPRIFYYNHTKPPYNAPTLPAQRFPARGVPTRWGNKLKGAKRG